LHLGESEAHINFILAIARIMGNDVTAKAVQHQMPRLRELGKQQLQSLKEGRDPKDITIGTMANANNQGQKLDTCFVLHNTRFPCSFSLYISF
jgi:hypothetical protein